MENRITGLNPQPITEDEVDLLDNIPAQELCEEVKQLTAHAREGLLMKALAVSNEKCNDLILTQNVQVAELTQQVKNVESHNYWLERKLKDDVEKLSKDVKESNEKLSRDLNQTLDKITTTVSGIERQVNTATEKATDSATKTLNERVNQAADDAVFKMNQQAQSLTQKVKEAEKEIEKAKDEIAFESGFRKFFFWATPVLLLVQSVISVLLLLK